MRGRESPFDDLSKKHPRPMDRLKSLYVQARTRLRPRERITCQQIIVDAVDKALAEPERAEELLVAGAKRAEETAEWGGRTRTTSLLADVRVGDKLPLVWREYPVPVGELNRIYLEAWLYLRGGDLEACLEIIRGAIFIAEPKSDNTGTILDVEAKRAQTFLDDRAELTARRIYATGLYLGVVISAVVLTVVAFIGILLIPPVASGNLQDVLVCLGGGAIGAVVSTILRVSNTESIQYRVIMLRTATFRIVVGWLFAAALIFLIKGGIITIFRVPDDSTASFFFWAAVGFLAGFNEVWVQNLVTRTDSPDARNSSGGTKEAAKK